MRKCKKINQKGSIIIHCFNHSIDVIFQFLNERKIENPFLNDDLEFFQELELFYFISKKQLNF